MNTITLTWRTRLLCLFVTLTATVGMLAAEAPAMTPPECTLITPVAATATSGIASRAIDNNGGTRWESAFNDNQSITIDLGSSMSVKTVSIDWEAANAKSYILSGSNDNVNWTDIVTKTNMPEGERTDLIEGINGTYRYIKMQGLTRNLTYGYSIWEFYVCSDAIPVSDCTATTIATATATSGNAGLAVDDNVGTSWQSDATDPQTLTIDLGLTAMVKEISISWAAANAKDYTISGSLNGTDWTVIETLTNMATGARIDHFDGIDTQYRYLQITGTARNTLSGYTIYEFDVCVPTGTPDEPLECDSNFAATSASATSGVAAAAIDGDHESRWISNVSDPQSLTVDMGQVITVDFVKIDWETANAKNYTLSGSVDNVNWTLIATKVNMPVYGNHRIDDILVGGNYRYLKMTGTKRNTPYAYSIHEFEVCGAAPITYTLIPAKIQGENWYNMHGVSTQETSDTGGGVAVAYIDNNDWMDYPIEVPTTGEYIIDARISTTTTTGIIEYLLDGSSLGTISLPNTGGWQIWKTESKAVYLTAGQHMLRVKAASEHYNLNWIDIKAPCFSWSGATSTAWATATNWCGGLVPTANSDIVITPGANNPVISSGTAYAGTLTINAGATLTVAAGATLSVQNAVTVNPSGVLTVQNNGALLQSGNAANSGNIYLYKNANPLYRLDYTLWSAPITGQNLRTFSMGTSNNRFYEYKYDSTDGGTTYDEGYWPVDPISTYFTPGKGYLIRMPNSNGATGYNSGDSSITFEGIFNGVPNNGTYSAALSQVGNRYTAVGNPYPSPISVYAFLTNNSAKLANDTGLWFWRKRNNSESSSYVTLTLAGYAANGDDATTNQTGLGSFYTGSSSADTWFIAPGQGFLVQAKPGLADATLSFTNSIRRAAPGATQAFFKQAATPISRYWLNLKGQNASSQALVAYLPEGTTGLDFGYDGKKLSSETTLSLYSTVEESKLAVQARPLFEANDVVPMGYNAPASGQYTIAIDHTEGVFEQGQNIYLKDLQEGVIRNLTENDYTFTTDAGTFEGRFEVVYQTTALGTANPAEAVNVLVYRNESGINISANDAIASIAVYDLLGRSIFASANVNANTFSTGNLSAAHQAVIVKVKMANGCETTRKIIF